MSVFRFLFIFGLVAFSTLLHAQDWPTKPVRFVSPYPPGGSVDPLARVLAAKLSASLKQQFIVENRTGASASSGPPRGKSAPDATLVFIFDTHAVPSAQPQAPSTR